MPCNLIYHCLDLRILHRSNSKSVSVSVCMCVCGMCVCEGNSNVCNYRVSSSRAHPTSALQHVKLHSAIGWSMKKWLEFARAARAPIKGAKGASGASGAKGAKGHQIAREACWWSWPVDGSVRHCESMAACLALINVFSTKLAICAQIEIAAQRALIACCHRKPVAVALAKQNSHKTNK